MYITYERFRLARAGVAKIIRLLNVYEAESRMGLRKYTIIYCTKGRLQ